jgi:ketosteroid isomerase-like protein
LRYRFPAFAQAGTGDLRAQIAKVSEGWEKAYNAGDAAAVAALYTTDAKLMVPGAETGSDPKAVQKLIAGDIALGGKVTLKMEDVVGFGDYALETGSWAAVEKIYRDMWNSSMPSK